MRHLDLFTGIGGFTIAAESVGFETVAFSEINEDKCIVLKHYWPHVPNLGDICDERFNERATEIGPVDLITGGVPCQPASALGQMRGAADERWLWPEFVGVVRALRPGVAVAENPPSVLVLPEFHGVVGAIAALGYDMFWDVIPAAAFGAGHLRERVFIIATDSHIERRIETGQCVSERKSHRNNVRKQSAEVHRCSTSTDTYYARLQGHAGNVVRDRESGSHRPIAAPDLRGRVNCVEWWHEAHTGIPVLAPGISGRLAEAVSCCIGDSVVPQVAAAILQPVYEMLNK